MIGTPDDEGAVPNNATVNGSLSYPEAAILFDVDLTHMKETAAGWGGLSFVVNGQSLDVTVTGAAETSIEWAVGIKVTSI